MCLPCIIGLRGPELDADETEAIRRYQPAGFMLFSRNISDAEQTRALTDRLRQLSARHHPVIAIDQEGGRVVRTAALGIELPSALDLRRSGDAGAIALMARLIAESLLLLGINTDMAPVLDIGHDERVGNALPGRCWGGDAREVIVNAGMFNENLTHAGIAGCAKHFPGMGQAGVDPHHDLPVIRGTVDELMRSELLPFLALMPRLDAVMVAHLILPDIDPGLPSSLSPAVMTKMLRDRMGYQKPVLTDDLCMQAITDRYRPDEAGRMALDAGCDLPMICHGSLEYLADFADRVPASSDYRSIDREKRIKRFCGKLRRPLPWDRARWDRVVDDSRQFQSTYSHSDEGQPSSPVHQY